METPYSKAWKKFIRSKEAIGLLSRMGSASVYSENKLRVAFDAGWNAREDNAPSLCHEHELPCDDDGECVQCHEMKWLEVRQCKNSTHTFPAARISGDACSSFGGGSCVRICTPGFTDCRGGCVMLTRKAGGGPTWTA